MQSHTGTQHGDPLGMLLFALALALTLLVEYLHTAFPRLPLQAWYTEDGTLADPAHPANDFLSFFTTRGSTRGFRVNLQKTSAWWPSLPLQTIHSSAPSPCSIKREHCDLEIEI